MALISHDASLYALVDYSLLLKCHDKVIVKLQV